MVTKAEILGALWTGREVSDASLTKCVARLRRALNDFDHTIVHTVHGYGYRFVAPVTAEACPASRPQATPLALQAGDTLPARPGWTLVRLLGTSTAGDIWLCQDTLTQDPPRGEIRSRRRWCRRLAPGSDSRPIAARGCRAAGTT